MPTKLKSLLPKKQKPNADWLNMVVTAKAKSRIKYYLKEEKREIADEGKEMLLCVKSMAFKTVLLRPRQYQ